MEKQKTILPFKSTVSDPCAAHKKFYAFMSGMAFESGEILGIWPVDTAGKVVDMMIETPIADVPALIQTLINLYEDYQRGNPYLPKIAFPNDAPDNVLSLRIKYEAHDSEYNEERLFPNTAEGMDNAIRTAQEINRPQEGEFVADIFAETVELFRWVDRGTYYEPEEIETWNHEKLGVKIEVGKIYVMDWENTLVNIHDIDPVSKAFIGTINEDERFYFDEYGDCLNGEDGVYDIVAEYNPDQPWKPSFTHTVHQ